MTRMKLLAIETATEACSVALWIDSEVRERFEIAPRQHSSLVLPWADALLAEAGLARSALDAVACGRGPGAFTGVRLAVALTQGIALALDRPVVGVSTLAALAEHALEDHAPDDGDAVFAALDARMGEVYAACFARGRDGLVPMGGEHVMAPEALELPDRRVHGVGTGFAAVDGSLQRRFAGRLASCDPQALPHASAVARLAARAFERGEAIDAALLQPAYLRDRVALTIREREAARDAAGLEKG